MIERVLAVCSALPADSGRKLVAFLRRFEAQAAREEARRIAGALADEAALRRLEHHAPKALDNASFATAA